MKRIYAYCCLAFLLFFLVPIIGLAESSSILDNKLVENINNGDYSKARVTEGFITNIHAEIKDSTTSSSECTINCLDSKMIEFSFIYKEQTYTYNILKYMTNQTDDILSFYEVNAGNSRVLMNRAVLEIVLSAFVETSDYYSRLKPYLPSLNTVLHPADIETPICNRTGAGICATTSNTSINLKMFSNDLYCKYLIAYYDANNNGDYEDLIDKAINGNYTASIMDKYVVDDNYTLFIDLRNHFDGNNVLSDSIKKEEKNPLELVIKYKDVLYYYSLSIPDGENDSLVFEQSLNGKTADEQFIISLIPELMVNWISESSNNFDELSNNYLEPKSLVSSYIKNNDSDLCDYENAGVCITRNDEKVLVKVKTDSTYVTYAINYYKSLEDNSNDNEEETTDDEIPDETKEKLLDMLELTKNGYKRDDNLVDDYELPKEYDYIDFNFYSMQSLFLNFQDNEKIEINSMSNDDIKRLIFIYALKHGMMLIDKVSGDDYQYCSNGDDYCDALSIEDYKKIASKYGLDEDGSNYFEEKEQYNNYYLYDYGGTVINIAKIEDSVLFTKDGDNIIVTYNIKTEFVADASYSKNNFNKKAEYTFRLNDDKEYYLYSFTITNNEENNSNESNGTSDDDNNGSENNNESEKKYQNPETGSFLNIAVCIVVSIAMLLVGYIIKKHSKFYRI